MLVTRSPETVAPPGGLYSHSVEIPPNARWLYLAGQIGVRRGKAGRAGGDGGEGGPMLGNNSKVSLERYHTRISGGEAA